jgi:hypothetical protein
VATGTGELGPPQTKLASTGPRDTYLTGRGRVPRALRIFQKGKYLGTYGQTEIASVNYMVIMEFSVSGKESAPHMRPKGQSD